MATEPDPVSEVGLEYARRLYDRVIAWYESAERKAQLILTLDGVFLSFLTASVLTKPDDLHPIVDRFGAETWALFGLMCVALFLSIASAVGCLVSRIYTGERLEEEYEHMGVRRDDPATYAPEALWFFQDVAGLSPDGVRECLRGAGDDFERDALAVQAVLLARNVVAKHRLVNYGFVFAGLVLCLFLGAGLSYVLRIA